MFLFLFSNYKRCGCVNPYLWASRSVVLPEIHEVFQAPLCNVSDRCIIIAADEYMNLSFDTNKYRLNCPQKCSIIDFISEKSSLSTPVECQMSLIKEFVENSSIPLPSNWSTTWRQHIYQNYLSITIGGQTGL